MKQRKQTSDNNGTTQQPAETVEPLDESDQEQVIQEFRRELTQQHQQLSQSFGWLVYAVTGTTILTTLYLEGTHYQDVRGRSLNPNAWGQLLALYHGVVGSPLLHLVAIRLGVDTASSAEASAASTNPSKRSSFLFTSVLVLLLLDSACVIVSSSFADHDPRSTLHKILLAANLVTLGFAWILRREQQSTEQSLSDLRDAQYHYKSL